MPWRTAGVVCLALALSQPALAQQTIDYASIAGRVSDPQGASLSGAQVRIRQTDTNIVTEAVTDAAGRFRFPRLQIGPYELKVRAAGFAELTRSVLSDTSTRH